MYKKDINFYRSGEAQKILARYPFSKIEREIIVAAVVSAKKQKPDMRIIQKADALLRMVTSTQEPVSKEEEKQSDAALKLALAEIEYSAKDAEIQNASANRYGNKIMLIGVVRLS